jgi:hypothetical protein
MKKIARILPFFLLILLTGGGLLAALIDDIGSALRGREYNTAVRLSEGENTPQVLLLRANALRIQGKFSEAITAYDRVLAARDASNERAKARFGKAYSLMSL